MGFTLQQSNLDRLAKLMKSLNVGTENNALRVAPLFNTN